MRRDKKGFLLLEVLVSLSILAVGLLAISRAFSTSIQTNSYLQSFTKATFLAQGKLTELETTHYLSLGKMEGGFGEDYPGYSWQAEIISAEEAKLTKIILTIFWKKGNKEYRIVLKTLIPQISVVES